VLPSSKQKAEYIWQTQTRQKGRAGGGKLLQALWRLGAPPSLKNTKYIRIFSWRPWADRQTVSENCLCRHCEQTSRH